MKDEILEQIDRLKMMVMLDDTPPKKTALELYEEWVEEMQGRRPRCWRNHNPFDHCGICDPRKYAEYRTVKALVDDLYHEKNKHGVKYQENKPEIRRMIAEIVAMTMYVQEKV